jgi:hypothetical protein
MKLFGSVLLFLLYGFSFSPYHQDKVGYFIAGNTLAETEDKEWKQRQMTVMVDASDFTEERLRQLAEELLKKYPEPDNLSISLKSHIDQLPFCIGERYHNAFDKYPHGGINRFRGNEFIRYAIPPSREWRTIVLKGKV